MPILLSKKISAVSAYAIWNISETESQLRDILLDTPPNSSQNKRSEWIVTRILVEYLCSLFEVNYEGVDNDEAGKPFLINQNVEISITHSFPMAGVLISLSKPGGIDIEWPRQKLINIQSKFLNSSEKKYEGNIDSLCKVWMAKEVLFKIHGKRSLSFKDDMSVQLKENWNAIGKILKEGEESEHQIIYEPISNYLIAYNT